MSTIFCRKYQQQLPSLAKPPYPGKDGEYIHANLSAKAWKEWLKEQTRLVNEHQLNPLDPKARTYIREQMFHFINNEPYDTARGHIPTNQNDNQ